MSINFRGRANVKYFMQIQFSRFYKDTFVKNNNEINKKKRKILMLCIELKQIKYKSSPKHYI